MRCQRIFLSYLKMPPAERSTMKVTVAVGQDACEDLRVARFGTTLLLIGLPGHERFGYRSANRQRWRQYPRSV